MADGRAELTAALVGKSSGWMGKPTERLRSCRHHGRGRRVRW